MISKQQKLNSSPHLHSTIVCVCSGFTSLLPSMQPHEQVGQGHVGLIHQLTTDRKPHFFLEPAMDSKKIRKTKILNQNNLELSYSVKDLQVSTSSTIWEFIRNADSEVLVQTHQAKMCLSIRPQVVCIKLEGILLQGFIVDQKNKPSTWTSVK